MAQPNSGQSLPWRNEAGIEEIEEQAFFDEDKNLAEVEGKIGSAVNSFDKRIRRAESDLSFVPVDIEGRVFRVDEMRSLENLKKRKAALLEYQDSPYFGHIDVKDDEGNPVIMFIGEKGLAIGGETVIVDWRSDMGEIYYNKQSRKFLVKGRNYELLLRRALSISESKLLAVHTEYDSSISEFDGDVVDPFLVSVLRDKRRNYRLTDIIKTIQQNQNEIMRLPLSDSFIVQGCAGSGKTMILFHRLSYLAYNHKASVDFSRFAIITPSDFFNEHVDELGEQLGLSMIGRYTTEGYYARLIRRMSVADVYLAENGARKEEKPKIVVPSSIVLSEDYLGGELLAEIYSAKLVSDIESDIASALSDVVSVASSSGLPDLFERYSVGFPTRESSAYSAYVMLKRGARVIRQGSRDVHEEIASAEMAFARAQQRFNEATEWRRFLDESFESRKEEVRLAALEEIDDLESAIESAKRRSEEIASSIAATEEEVAAFRLEGEKIERDVREIKEEFAGASKPRDVLENRTPLGYASKKACAELLSGITEKTRSLAAAEASHVLRSRMEDAELEAAKIGIVDRIKESSSDATRRLSLKITAAQNELESANRELESALLARQGVDDRLEEARNDILNLKSGLGKLAAVKKSVSYGDYLFTSYDPTVVQLRSLLESELADLAAMSDELSNLGLLSFRRKRELAEKTARKREGIITAAEEEIAKMEATSTTALNGARLALEEANASSAQIEAVIDSYSKLISKKEADLDALKQRSRKIASIAIDSMSIDSFLESTKGAVESLRDGALQHSVDAFVTMQHDYSEAALERVRDLSAMKASLNAAYRMIDTRVSDVASHLIDNLLE